MRCFQRGAAFLGWPGTRGLANPEVCPFLTGQCALACGIWKVSDTMERALLEVTPGMVSVGVCSAFTPQPPLSSPGAGTP